MPDHQPRDRPLHMHKQRVHDRLAIDDAAAGRPQEPWHLPFDANLVSLKSGQTVAILGTESKGPSGCSQYLDKFFHRRLRRLLQFMKILGFEVRVTLQHPPILVTSH